MSLSGIAGQWVAAIGFLFASLVCTPAAATTVSAGYSHSCAASSTKAPQCWGTLAAPQWLTGRDYIDIQSGRDFSCALHKSGTVSCWGNNDYFQLGIPTGATPGQSVSGLPAAVQVAVGERHACARTHGRDVYCWGDAGRGQLGTAAGSAASAVAVKVPGLSGAVQVAAAQASTCAVLQGGAVACVGAGSLLAGADSDPGTPRTLPGIGDAVRLAVAEGHGCLVRSGGQVVCWGRNASGELGTTASPAIAAVPVEVPGLGGPAQAVATGAGFSCALLQSGTLACWGKNTSGQLGTGYPLNAAQAPAPVVGILKALSLSAGAEHTCAVLEGGYVNCWGNGANNRLSIASCDLSSAYYPGFTYARGPSFNNAACGSTGPAVTPYAVDKLGPNRDIELVMRWAGRTLPDVFPGDYFSELFDNIPNFWLSNYRNSRYLAVNMHGTPKLIFLGPESGNAMVDLGPLIDWVRPINPITPYIGQWVLTTNQPYYPPCTIDVRHATDDSSAGQVFGTCYVSNGEERVDLYGEIDSRGVVTAASRLVNAPFSIYGLLNKDGSGDGVWKSGWIGTQWTASKR
ncbi:RCC1 domain-containing protein [Acidovorax sp. A1169]|uniref:RCC1 domain-containing protein n=1 Tax=Acidovorax sp. A1169 TaxID=3059524 RepID=UPI003520ABFD